MKKAAKIDDKYNAWIAPGPGPVESRLRQYGRVEGLAIGAHGEGSKDLLKLIDRMAERGAVRRHRDLGYVSAGKAFSAVKKHLYLVLGIEAVRGAARLTLTNLGSILAGPASTKAATARRRNARLKYRQAVDFYWAAHCHFDVVGSFVFAVGPGRNNSNLFI